MAAMAALLSSCTPAAAPQGSTTVTSLSGVTIVLPSGWRFQANDPGGFGLVNDVPNGLGAQDRSAEGWGENGFMQVVGVVPGERDSSAAATDFARRQMLSGATVSGPARNSLLGEPAEVVVSVGTTETLVFVQSARWKVTADVKMPPTLTAKPMAQMLGILQCMGFTGSLPK
jgi:hypothetical protein